MKTWIAVCDYDHAFMQWLEWGLKLLVQGKVNFNLYRILDLLYIIVFVLLIQRRPDPASIKKQ